MTSYNPDALTSKLDTMRARISKILLDTPSSRSSDKILLITYLKRHGPFCYDEATKRLQFRDKDGCSYEDWLTMPSTESICRIKRFIQRDAKLRLLAGMGTREDAEVLPSSRVAEQRAVLEGINRQYFYRV